MRRIVIGVMGPGAEATAANCQDAYEVGRLIAQQQWVLLTGSRNAGVMDAANRGAKQEDGVTIGIMPTEDDAEVSEAVDIVIFTGMGSARNNINVLSSNAIVVCGMGSGTASEIALAIKAHKTVVLLHPDQPDEAFFRKLSNNRIFVADCPEAVIAILQSIVITN